MCFSQASDSVDPGNVLQIGSKFAICILAFLELIQLGLQILELHSQGLWLVVPATYENLRVMREASHINAVTIISRSIHEQAL